MGIYAISAVAILSLFFLPDPWEFGERLAEEIMRGSRRDTAIEYPWHEMSSVSVVRITQCGILLSNFTFDEDTRMILETANAGPPRPDVCDAPVFPSVNPTTWGEVIRDWRNNRGADAFVTFRDEVPGLPDVGASENRSTEQDGAIREEGGEGFSFTCSQGNFLSELRAGQVWMENR